RLVRVEDENVALDPCEWQVEGEHVVEAAGTRVIRQKALADGPDPAAELIDLDQQVSSCQAAGEQAGDHQAHQITNAHVGSPSPSEEERLPWQSRCGLGTR